MTYSHYVDKPSTESVLATINSKSWSAYDKTVKGGDLTAGVEGTPTEYNFSPSAFRQLCNKHHIPLVFFNRCSDATKQRIFTEFITERNDSYLFRLLEAKNKDGEDALPEYVRAVLSTQYGIIDDTEVFSLLFDTLSNEDVSAHQFMYDENMTRLLIRFEDTDTHYKGWDMCAGLQVINSETGHSALWVEPVVITPSCSFMNRRSLRQQNVDARIIHRGDINQERIRNMAQQAERIAQVGIVQIAEAWEDRISVSQALTFAKSIDSLPKRLYDILEEEWSEAEGLARAAVAEKIICLARELPLFQQVQTEQATGNFIGLFKGYEARIGAIMEEINE